MKYPLLLSLTRSQRLFLTLWSICRWCVLPCALRIIIFSHFQAGGKPREPTTAPEDAMSNIPTAQNREWGLSHPICDLHSVVLNPPPPPDWILIPSSQTIFFYIVSDVFFRNLLQFFFEIFVSTLNFGYVFLIWFAVEVPSIIFYILFRVCLLKYGSFCNFLFWNLVFD